MREPAHGACLVQPLVDGAFVASIVEQLERHLSVKPVIVRQPDHRLRATAEFAQQREAANALGIESCVHAAAVCGVCASGGAGLALLSLACTAAVRSRGVMASTRT